MLTTSILGVAVLLFLVLSGTPRIRQSDEWTATVTPLASIMGSGFLVCAPLLASVAGNFSLLIMAALLGFSWLLGSAIRFNIRFDDTSTGKPPPATTAQGEHRLHRSHRAFAIRCRRWTDRAGHYVLAIAYLISVTYYIKLLAQFSLDKFGFDSEMAPKIVASIVLAVIASIGFFYGLKMIEKVERYAINLNLAMIAALIMGLLAHNFDLWQMGEWALPAIHPDADRWHAFRVCLGLLIVVQGFETSRFLGAEHSAPQRARTMSAAQGIATVIYLVFLLLMLVVMTPEQASADAGVTAIVTLSASVAAVLPIMITIAAIGSQFSAAVADEAGCGGLIQTIGGQLLSGRSVYLVIGAATIGLCWLVDVMQVIAYASRSFAAYYALECATASNNAWSHSSKNRQAGKAVLFAALGLACVGVALLGQAVE